MTARGLTSMKSQPAMFSSRKVFGIHARFVSVVWQYIPRGFLPRDAMHPPY